MNGNYGRGQGKKIEIGHNVPQESRAGYYYTDSPNYYIAGLYLSHALMIDKCCEEWDTDINGFFGKVWGALRKEGWPV